MGGLRKAQHPKHKISADFSSSDESKSSGGSLRNKLDAIL
jgi:hypothetical protein